MANDKNFVVKNGLEVGGQLIVDAQGNIQLPDGSFSSIEGLYDVTEYTNVQNQTTFELVYDVGLVQVLYNGVQLAQTDFTATNGTSVVLDVAVENAEDVITIIRWGAINESSVVVEAPTPTTVPKRTSTGAIRAAEGSAADEVVTKSQLDLKVDTEAGKGLSTEDYTTAEKSKLAGIEAGAEVNTVDSVAGKTGVVVLAKADVGLGNVDNTSDVDKPVSTATQSALDLKAPLASPTLTGVPAAPTATSGTNTTQIATTAFVQGAVSGLVDAAPETLDTLNELAAALGDDPNFATTVSNQIGGKAPLTGEGTSGTWGISITGSADSLTTARTIALGGDVSGSASFDGSANITITANVDSKVSRTSSTGSAVIPAGTELQRDASPLAGYFRFNSDTNKFEGYNGVEWGEIAGGGGGASFSSATVIDITTTESGNTFSLGEEVSDALVSLNGAWVSPHDFSLSGNNIVFGFSLEVNDEILVYPIIQNVDDVQLVDNLSSTDATKALSANQGSVIQAALDLKAPLASPALSGTPTAPTADAGTNTTQVATTAFVQSAVSGLVDAAPETLDTLNELAAALGDDPNFATTVSTQIGTKLDTNTWTNSAASAITSTQVSNWDTAYGWGDHGLAGYAPANTTVTTNTTQTISGAKSLTSNLTLGSGGSYEDLILKTDTIVSGYNGTFSITPRTVPGSGVASQLTYFKNNILGAGTTRHDVSIDGNVGIGTSSPAGIFDVEGTKALSAGKAGVVFNTIVTPANNGIGSVGLFSGTINGPASANSSSKISGLRVALSTSGSFLGAGEFAGIKIDTFNAASATNAYGLYVDTPTGGQSNYAASFNGNVGIGTNSPAEKLHVNGSIRWGGSTDLYTYSGIDGGGLYFEQVDNNTGKGKIRLQTRTNDTGGYTSLGIDADNAKFVFTNGNVLIGTATDNGVDKLQVNGDTIIYGGLKAENSVIASYTSRIPISNNTWVKAFTIPNGSLWKVSVMYTRDDIVGTCFAEFTAGRGLAPSSVAAATTPVEVDFGALNVRLRLSGNDIEYFRSADTGGGSRQVSFSATRVI